MPKDKYFLIIISIITLLLCGGCQKEPISLLGITSSNEFSTTGNNSIIHQAQANEPEDCLLYIINDPSEDELAQLLSYTQVNLDSEAPLTLLAPCKQESLLKIYRLDYNEENQTYERTDEVWTLDSTGKGFIAAAQLNYGAAEQPTYEIYIENGEAYGSYFFALPTEGETLPHIDYLTKQGTVITMRGLD